MERGIEQFETDKISSIHKICVLSNQLSTTYPKRNSCVYAFMCFFQKIAKQNPLKPAVVLALALLFFWVKTSAQAPIQLRLLPLNGDSSFIQKNIKHAAVFADSALVFNELKNIIAQLRAQSYLEASIDSTHRQDSTLTVWLHVGQAYEWASLSNGNVPDELLNRSGFRPKLFNGKPLRFSEIQKLQERLLQEAENTGFPFAKVSLDSLTWVTPKSEIRNPKSEIEAQLFLTPGSLVLFDSLTVEGDAKISMNYLRQYLGIHEGKPYSRQQMLRIRQRVRELPFLQEKKNALVTFREGKANLQLFLEKKKASRFDFLLGVLPDNGRVEQKLLITGNFNAEFQLLLWEERLKFFNHLATRCNPEWIKHTNG